MCFRALGLCGGRLMRRWLILFICLITGTALAGQLRVLNPFIPASTGFDCSAYDVCQNLEGVGYDNSETWTETLNDATIDEDYSTNPIVGSESLRIVDGGADGNVYIGFGPNADGDTTYVYFRIRFDAAPTANFYMMKLYDWSSLAASFRVKYPSGYLEINHGTQALTGSIDITDGTVYHIWLEWTTDSGAGDGVLKSYISTTGTKPASPDANIDYGDCNLPGVDRLYINSGGGSTYVVDRILVDDSVIGNQ